MVLFIPSFRDGTRNFCVGILSRRYDNKTKFLLTNRAFTLCLLIFVFLFSYKLMQPVFSINFFIYGVKMIPIMWLYDISLALSGVLVCVYLFRNSIVRGKMALILSYLGKCSLEIYIIHILFRFAIFDVGDYIYYLVDVEDCRLSMWNFTFQLLYSFVVSIVVVSLTLCLMLIIKRSKFLAPILLGRSVN